MDDDTRKYYESLIDTFATQGWKEFNRDIGESLAGLIDNSYNECHKSKDWHKRRGEIEQLSRIVNYENFIRQAFESLEAEDDPI